MRPIAPRVGLPEVTLAEEQEEFAPMTVAPVDFEDGRGGLLSRWTFTAAERDRIANGEDLYLVVLTCGQPMQPLSSCVGPPAWLG